MEYTDKGMYVNGYIIQKAVDNGYKGVDGSGFSSASGENWYLNGIDEYRGQFEPYFEKVICGGGRDAFYIPEPHTHAGVCTDLDYIKRYIEVSKKLGIKYRVLLVMTEIPSPVIEPDPSLKLKFLGYDYAYEAPDNYSAVYNEVPGVFPDCRLNSNGLFETREEMDDYLVKRKKFEETHPPYTLEAGDFTVFKLYEIEM